MVIARTKSSLAVQQARKLLKSLAGGCSITRPRSLFVAVLMLAASSFVNAQVGSSEVHILPRAMPGSSLSTQQVFRANADLVLVTVTVLDQANRAVTGLQPTNFAVLDDKIPQVARYLSKIDDPISLVVVLDASASNGPENPGSAEGFC